jgi:hypothetical protein
MLIKDLKIPISDVKLVGTEISPLCFSSNLTYSELSKILAKREFVVLEGIRIKKYENKFELSYVELNRSFGGPVFYGEIFEQSDKAMIKGFFKFSKHIKLALLYFYLIAAILVVIAVIILQLPLFLAILFAIPLIATFVCMPRIMIERDGKYRWEKEVLKIHTFIEKKLRASII